MKLEAVRFLYAELHMLYTYTNHLRLGSHKASKALPWENG